MEFTDEPLEPFGETLLDMSVPTQLSFKTPLVFRMVRELTKRGCLPWTGSHRCELCFDEALTNAMMHGNKLDASKKVYVTLCADAEQWALIIRDEGAGFDPEDVPDPNDPDFIFQEAGRGIMLMEGYLDALKYNRKANRLMLAHARQEEPEEAEAEAAVLVSDEAPPEEGPVTLSREGNVDIIELRDPRMADENIEAIRKVLHRQPEKGVFVVLDLSRVEYISSVGIGAMIGFYKKLRTQDGHLILAAVQPAVVDILKSARLEGLFQREPDRATAVTAMKKLA